ncbi:hypothetical protein M2119_001263 [Aurantimicrobium minutum]|nr:hypothetical protein [Aurantimicrobium minutum]
MAYETTDSRENIRIMLDSADKSDQALRDIYAWPDTQTFRLNLLATPDGIVGPDGTSHSLTNPEDRRILRAIRAEADVVIVGAESVRTEGWFLPPHGRLMVLSSTGFLPWDTCPDSTRVFVAPSASAIVHNLAKTETRVLCEGGLETAKLIAERIGFDEIALSTTGDDIPPMLSFLHIQDDFALASQLINSLHQMTFRYWRRAVEGRS